MNDPFRVGLLASPFLPKATQGMNVCANYNTMQLFMQVFCNNSVCTVTIL